MKLSEGLNIQSSEIKNIIFDWGGVITDLHTERTINAFRAMGFKQLDEVYSHDENQNLFSRFEMGKIDESAFMTELKQQLDPHVTDEQVLDAWNALLGDLPAGRWNLLENLRHHYRIFLLSNTNSLHITYYFRKIEKLYGSFGYNHLFEKVYFSHHLGMRKPNRNIYEFVLKDSNLVPGETLFIDDNPDNLATARQLGIITYHLSPPLTLTDLFE